MKIQVHVKAFYLCFTASNNEDIKDRYRWILDVDITQEDYYITNVTEITLSHKQLIHLHNVLSGKWRFLGLSI